MKTVFRYVVALAALMMCVWIGLKQGVICMCSQSESITASTSFPTTVKTKREAKNSSLSVTRSFLADNESSLPLPVLRNPLVENCSVRTDIDSVCAGGVGSLKTWREPRCPLEQLSRDCELLRSIHLYEDKPVEKEESEFPLAFGLKMHTSPEQAEQLLRAIYRPHNIYCIHVDGHAKDAVFRMMSSVTACFPNVVMTERVKVVYGGYSVVEAELTLMKCALHSSVAWKYYLNLAGQEFPLKTNLEMVRSLSMLNGSNDIESFPMPANLQARIKFRHESRNRRTVKTAVRKKPKPFQAEVRKGLQYGAFSRAFVASLLTNRTLLDIVAYYNDTYSPDETIWPTLNAVPGAAGGYPGHITRYLSRAVVWQNYKFYKCRGKYVRRVCVFAKGDLPWLLRQPGLIANKFKKEDDPSVLSCLEAMIGHRARSRGMTVDRKYISSLPHAKFRGPG